MRARGLGRFLVVTAGLLGCAAVAHALPQTDEPVDPAKRAPISTSSVLKPSARAMQGDGVVGGRVIRMNDIPLRRSNLGASRAAVSVRETRGQERVIKPTARANTVRTFQVRRAADRPAAIPRIAPDRFRQMLREYEENRLPAAALTRQGSAVGEDRVSLADINRFANPRAALEAQGIPVTAAASAAPADASSTPVPVAADANRAAE